MIKNFLLKIKKWILLMIFGAGVLAAPLVIPYQPIGEPGPAVFANQDIQEKRNLNSKHIDNGDGTFTMSAHLAHIHYLDDNDELQNIDCRFTPMAYGGWEMRTNNYELEIPRKADGWFKFINSFGYDSRGKEKKDRPDEVVAIRALGLGKQLSGDPVFRDWHAVYGELIEKSEWKGKGIVLYKDAYGPDIDLEVMARNTGFVKEVAINKKPSDLSQDLEFAFEIDIGNLKVKPKKADYMKLRDKKIKEFKGLKDKELLKAQKKYEDVLERETWDKSSKLETSESIILEKLRKTWFRKFNLYDSEGNQGKVKVRLENIEGHIILTKVLDKTFLENAVYPVRTDTTTSYYAGAGDGRVSYLIFGHPDFADWDTAHDAAVGTDMSTGSCDTRIRILGLTDFLYIYRSFYPIDTSGLGASATILGAILKPFTEWVYDDYDGSNYAYMAVVKTFQASTSELVLADYEDCGYDTGNETGGRAKYIAVKGSANIDITGLNEGAYSDFTLNEIGLSWIQKEGTTMLGLRNGQDIEHAWEGDPGEVDKSSGAYIRSSEQTDTDEDPYLEVVYEIPVEDEGNMFLMF